MRFCAFCVFLCVKTKKTGFLCSKKTSKKKKIAYLTFCAIYAFYAFYAFYLRKKRLRFLLLCFLCVSNFLVKKIRFEIVLMTSFTLLLMIFELPICDILRVLNLKRVAHKGQWNNFGDHWRVNGTRLMQLTTWF